jgi:hypothetical protein
VLRLSLPPPQHKTPENTSFLSRLYARCVQTGLFMPANAQKSTFFTFFIRYDEKKIATYQKNLTFAQGKTTPEKT